MTDKSSFVEVQLKRRRQLNTLINDLTREEYYGCTLRYMKIIIPDDTDQQVHELNESMKNHRIAGKFRALVTTAIKSHNFNTIQFNEHGALRFLHGFVLERSAGNKESYYLTLLNLSEGIFTIAMIKLEYNLQTSFFTLNFTSEEDYVVDQINELALTPAKKSASKGGDI